MTFDIETQLERGMPFHDLLGIEILELDDGRAVATLPHDESLSSIDGQRIAHGGVAPALADAVAGVAINALNGRTCPTIDLRTDYLHPITGDVTAVAEVVHNGASVGVVDVDVHDTNEVHVASARGVFKTGGDTPEGLWSKLQADGTT